MKESTKLFLFSALRKFSFFKKTHLKLFFFIVFVPYILSMTLFAIFKTPIIGIALIISNIFMIVPVSLGSGNVYFFDDEKDGYKKNYFSMKWLNRGSGQYIFIIPKNDFQLTLYVYNTQRINFMSENYLFVLHSYDSHWGEWDLSNTIHTSKKDIKKYGLNILAAQILLSK